MIFNTNSGWMRRFSIKLMLLAFINHGWLFNYIELAQPEALRMLQLCGLLFLLFYWKCLWKPQLRTISIDLWSSVRCYRYLFSAMTCRATEICLIRNYPQHVGIFDHNPNVISCNVKSIKWSASTVVHRVHNSKICCQLTAHNSLF